MHFIKKTSKYLLFTITFLLIALPYATKFGAVYYLENEEKVEARIDDVSINFFTGKIGLEGVHIYGEKSGELHLNKLLIDISITALFQKNILIESIEFNNFSTNITEEKNGWNVGGIFIPTKQSKIDNIEESNTKQAFDFGIGIKNIDFTSIKAKISSQYTDSHFTLNTLKISDVMSWRPSTASTLEISLSINDKKFNINGKAKPFIKEPSLKTRVTIDSIQIKPFLKGVNDLPFKKTKVAVFSDFELSLIKKDTGLAIKLDGHYGLKDIHLEDEVRKINIAKLMWQGQQSILLPISETDKKAKPEEDIKKIALDGLLSIDGVNIYDSKNNAHITQKNLTLNGTYDIELDSKSEIPAIKASMGLILNKLNINTLDDNIKITSFDTWETKKINVNGINDVTIQESKLSNLIVLKNNKSNKKEKTPAIAQLSALIINDIRYKPESININKIALKQLSINVSLDEKGELPLITEVAPNTADSTTGEDATKIEPEKTETKKSPITITLNEFTINQKSNIRFTDNSVTPIFNTNLHDLTLLLVNIDSRDKKSLTDIDLGVQLNDYGTLSIKGNTQPFSDKINANLTAKLNGLELVPLSSYAAKFAGINLKRGTLDFDASIKVKNDILDVNNTFYLNKLIVESNENEVSNNVFKDMPIPLDLTLNVLRDKNNIIKLDIPVKGDINNPDFSLQDIYNTAMVKAMKFAATHYLTQAIQPLGLIITAGKLIGKAAAPSFDPLIFDIGTATISKTNKSHIKKLAKVLQEKDKLKFTICGVATESDWKFIQAQNKSSENKTNNEEALAQDQKVSQTKEKEEPSTQENRTKTLLQLANQRTKQVKKHFVEEYKIKPSRLFTCNGKIYKDKKDKPAIPAVEIGL